MDPFQETWLMDFEQDLQDEFMTHILEEDENSNTLTRTARPETD
jgi:hypothetical protein